MGLTLHESKWNMAVSRLLRAEEKRTPLTQQHTIHQYMSISYEVTYNNRTTWQVYLSRANVFVDFLLTL
jgi:hypothetical protein